MSLFGLGACSATNSSNEASSTSSSVASSSSVPKKLKQPQYAQGLEISLIDLATATKGDSSKFTILSIKMKAKNLNKEEMGFGSNDFVLKYEKKTLPPFADGVNFGEGIKMDKSLQGTMTFEVPKDVNKATLVYRPYDKELATWDITF